MTNRGIVRLLEKCEAGTENMCPVCHVTWAGWWEPHRDDCALGNTLCALSRKHRKRRAAAVKHAASEKRRRARNSREAEKKRKPSSGPFDYGLDLSIVNGFLKQAYAR